MLRTLKYANIPDILIHRVSWDMICGNVGDLLHLGMEKA